MESVDHCLNHLKENDKQAYLSILLMPQAYQADLAALYAFQTEITRIRFMVREAIPGEIRLQWWRDALAGKDAEAKANPLFYALLKAIEKNDLPKEDFDKMLLARAFDLYNDPLPLWSDFETYAGETRSLFLRLMCLVTGASYSKELADACGHAGVALTIQQVLKNFGRDAAREQIFMPTEILQKSGAHTKKIINGEMHGELTVTFNEMIKHAESHYEKALLAISSLPKDSTIILKLLLCLVKPTFKYIGKQGYDPFNKPVHFSQAYQQWCLIKARYF